MASYNAEFAATWGQKVRDLLEAVGEEFFGIKIRQDRRASDSWGIVGHDGGMQTCGVGGGLTGKGAYLLLIDDPVKDAEDALSPTIRERTWDWFASAADTRLEPQGAVCLTMTPWHEDDLGGRILQREEGLWDVLRLPATADEPVSEAVRAEMVGYERYVGAPDPIGRAPGEPLWPERYGLEFFARKKKQDAFWYDALFECSPRPRDGGFFKREWFDGKVRDDVPDGGQYVRYWDKAASEGKGDWTSGALLMAKDGVVWVLDMARERMEPGPREAFIRETCRTDHALYGHVATWGEHAGNDAKESAANFVKNLMGFSAFTEGTGNKNKASRAYPFASYCQSGNVYLKRGHWVETFLAELASFRPEKNSGHDDQVDSASGAFGKLALGRAYIPSQAANFRRHDDALALALDGGDSW